MTISEDIIRDLLPVYQAGEASADTQALIEQYLAQHPDFAKTVADFDEPFALLEVALPDAQKEKEALMRVKQILKWRSILLGMALFCSLMPLSAAGNSNDGVTWFMLRDLPVVAAIFAGLALVSWLAYGWTFYQLSDRTGGVYPP